MGAWPPLVERPKVEVLGASAARRLRRSAACGSRSPPTGRPTATCSSPTATGRSRPCWWSSTSRRRPSARASRSGSTSPSSSPGAASSPSRSASTPAAIDPDRSGTRAPAALLPRLRRRQRLQRPGDLPEVDPKRIGVMGHSYGGKWAMFASCLVRQVRLRRLVRPRHRLRRDAAERQLLGALVSRLGARPDPQARPHHGREPPHRGLQATASRPATTSTSCTP